MNFKKFASVIMVLVMIFALAACSGNNSGSQTQSSSSASQPSNGVLSPSAGESEGTPVENASISIFACDSSLAFIVTATDMFGGVVPSITFGITLDEPVVLTEKILADYDCDIFVTDDDYFMNFIDKNGGEDNTYDLDYILEGSRTQFFKGVNDAGEEVTYTVAILNKSIRPLDCQAFIDWMAGLDDSVYEECGVSKIN